MLSILYDLPTISSAHEPTVTNIHKFTEVFIDYATPGRYFVELFPWMKYIPSSVAKWKREAEEGYKYYSKLFEDMFREVEHRIVMFFFPLFIVLRNSYSFIRGAESRRRTFEFLCVVDSRTEE